MQVTLGPFDPVLHVRSRDHYEAARREAQLLTLRGGSPPERLNEFVDHLTRQFPPTPVDAIVDEAYRAGRPTFTAWVEVSDELVPLALEACDRLEELLTELDTWAEDAGVQLLEAPDDIKAYRKAYLAQARAQLQAARAGG